MRFAALRVVTVLSRPFLKRKLVDQPFPVQFRRRLEMLGPTYIKLGQILSLRADLLPDEITRELKNLLDRLPVVPFERFLELVARGPGPAGRRDVLAGSIRGRSARRRSRRRTGPRRATGTRSSSRWSSRGSARRCERDAILLRAVRPLPADRSSAATSRKRVIDEFVAYTLREVDLRREADNAETFPANFEDMPDIVFPQDLPRATAARACCAWSSSTGSSRPIPGPASSPRSDRDRLIDLGAEAIIRMLYKDGFFHADLHPANLLILPGPKAAFIDLGMVGRFDDELRRTLLYYYYCLVMGDAENAARYLTAIAEPGPRRRPDRLPPRGRGDQPALGRATRVRELLPRPADPGVGEQGRALPHVLPRRDWC